MLQNPQFLEQARQFYQIRTYTAVRPIENPSVASQPASPPCYLAPQPCVSAASSNSDLPQDLEIFTRNERLEVLM